MNKKLLAFALLGLLILMTIPAIHAQPPTSPNNLIIDTIGEIETLDPAWSYDTASGEVIMNVYEPLIFFNVNWASPETASQAPGPYSAGIVDSFVPLITTTVPTTGNGLIVNHDPPLTSPQGLSIYSTWTFPIRTGIKFHDGNTLTPVDVEYSLERAMIQDRAGGPTWMLWEPLLGVDWASPPSGLDPSTGVYTDYGPADDTFGAKIDYAVQVSGNNLVLNLAMPYPELAVKQILAQAWGSIMERAFAVNEGDLPANWASMSWRSIWDPNGDGNPDDGWHNPAISFLEDAVGHAVKDGGTGPFQMDYYTSEVGYSVTRFADYWQGFGAPISTAPAGSRLPGYLDRITWNIYNDWTVRRGRFLVGDSDLTVVPRNYRDQVLGVQASDGELIRCLFRSQSSGKGITALNTNEFHMTLDINPTTTYAGTIQPNGQFSTTGIPLDIFDDVNVRIGFSYALDYNWFLDTAQLGEGFQPATYHAKGLAYYSELQQKRTFSLDKAEYYLKLAWGGVDSRSGVPGVAVLPEDKTLVTPGALWNGGMKFPVVWNTGNVARSLATSNLVANINSLNPTRFFLSSLDATWGTVVLPAMVAHQLPIFHIGWLADYADPHDFAFPYFSGGGTFAFSQHYDNAVVDAIITAGILTPDDGTPYAGQLEPTNGNSMQKLNNLPAGNWQTWSTNPAYYTANPLDTNFPRRAIYYALQEMWYEESIAPVYFQGLVRHFEQPWVHGWYYNALYPGIFGYHIWKAKTHFGDVNWDGTVDITDWTFLSSSWTGPPRGGSYFLPQADLTGGIGGTTGGNEGGVKGLPNGAVEIDDLSLVSAYWD